MGTPQILSSGGEMKDEDKQLAKVVGLFLLLVFLNCYC